MTAMRVAPKSTGASNMSIKPWLINLFVVFLAVSLTGCGRHGDETITGPQASSPASSAAIPSNLEIVSWGPTSTKAGVVFNKQPDGGAALWIRVNQSLEGGKATIEFDGTSLEGNTSGNLVTAVVPAALYAKPGMFVVKVIVSRGPRTMQSNSVEFRVD